MGGLLASAVIGAKGKILLYVMISFMVMLAIIFALGILFFDQPFSPASNPFMVISILFGLALGSAVINGR